MVLPFNASLNNAICKNKPHQFARVKEDFKFVEIFTQSID